MEPEKINFIDDIIFFDKYKRYKRVYFGSEFCEKKLFTLTDLKDIVSKKYKQKVTLVFPYLTQKYFDKVKCMASFINFHSDTFDEIVFNDWGLFYFIRKNYPDMKLVLGRLLTKQKTDPFFYNVISNKQGISFLQNNVFVPKKVTKETRRYFSQTLINSKIFQKFLVRNNIVRVELDNVNWEMEINLPKRIKASIYYPYVKITTTRFCNYLNMLKNKDCEKHCNKLTMELNKYRVPYNYVIRGNTVNYKNKILHNNKELIKNNIDRIIINE